MYRLIIALILASLAFPACATEDSSNCVWIAPLQGNGQGHSFVDIGGVVFPLAP